MTAPAFTASATDATFAPPAEWFHQTPDWLDPTWENGLVQIDDRGRVAALVAPYRECILDGSRDCWTAPPSPTGYEFAHVGAVKAADGRMVRVANIGGGVPHYDPTQPTAMSPAVDHYANSATRLMVGRYHDRPDLGGIVFLGSMWPGTTPADVITARASAISGDWRWVDSLKGYDFAGSQIVNNPGFRPNRSTARQFAVVACMAPMGEHAEVMRGMWDTPTVDPSEGRRERLEEALAKIALIEMLLPDLLLGLGDDEQFVDHADDVPWVAVPGLPYQPPARLGADDNEDDDWYCPHCSPGLAHVAGLDDKLKGKAMGAERLREYWGHGKGAAKIRWGTPGDWTRCYRHLSKFMGPRAKGYCFSGDTEFTTRDGVTTFAETVGTSQFVLTSRIDMGSNVIDGPTTNGYWVEARIEPFGEQPLRTITLGRGGVVKVIRATPEHRWMVSPDGRTGRRHDLLQRTTAELEPGMVLASLHAARPNDLHLSPDGIRAGLVFGDGSRQSKNRTAIDLWGAKRDLLTHFDGYSTGTEKQLDSGVLGVRVHGLPAHYKEAPDFAADPDYLYGWLAGYFAADGSVSTTGGPTLSSASRAALEHAKHVAALLGIATGSIGFRSRSGFGRPETDLFHMAFAKWSLPPEFFLRRAHRDNFGAPASRTSGRWHVLSVEDRGDVEPVYCAVVPETERFVLTEGIATFNCQLMHGRVTGEWAGRNQKHIPNPAVKALARAKQLSH